MRDIFTRRLTLTVGEIRENITFDPYLPTCRWISDLFKVSNQRIARSFNDSGQDDFVDTYTDSVTTLRTRLAALPVSTIISGSDSTFLMKQITFERCKSQFTKASSSSKFYAYDYNIVLPTTLFVKPALSQDDVTNILALINNIIHVRADDQQVFTWYDDLLNLLSSQLPLANALLEYADAARRDTEFFLNTYNEAMNQVIYSSSRVQSITGFKMTNWMYDYIMNKLTYHHWALNELSGRSIILTDYVGSGQTTISMHNVRISFDSLKLYAIDPALQYLFSMHMIDTEDVPFTECPLAPAATVSEYK